MSVLSFSFLTFKTTLSLKQIFSIKKKKRSKKNRRSNKLLFRRESDEKWKINKSEDMRRALCV